MKNYPLGRTVIAIVWLVGSSLAPVTRAQALLEPESPLCAKPAVSLVVKGTKLSVPRKGGTISFAVYAVAGGGFHGTVSGTVSVSQPGNPDQIALVSGNDGRSFPFTLAAGESTASRCSAPQKMCISVTTAPSNTRSGTLFYSVFLDASGQFNAAGGANTKQIEVTVQ